MSAAITKTLLEKARCMQIFEALVGTLRAAKRRKLIHYEGQMLLKGVHDEVFIELLAPAVEAVVATA